MDLDKTIYRILVRDIYGVAENADIPEDNPGVLSDEVVEKVMYKVEAMDFSDIADTIRGFIEDALAEVESAKNEKTVNSSHGQLIIDADGTVLVGKTTYHDDELRNIVRFDLPEHRKYYASKPEPDSYDILDLGYWMKDGTFEPPAFDWREIEK